MMKEINLGRVLIENRHKRGITQEELAEYIGVSKAAVSKWEIGMTYPDISLLWSSFFVTLVAKKYRLATMLPFVPRMVCDSR